MIDYSAQLTRIKDKLLRVRFTDPKLEVFGAGSHKYQTGKPLLALDLTLFEQQYGIRLPDDYRQFMLEIGPGAGPFYGLYALGSHTDEFSENPKTVMRVPSQWHPHLSEQDWLTLTQAFDQAEMSNADFERATDILFAGLLPLGTQGCTYYHALIVSGEHRGRVVNLDQERLQPKFAYESNFLDWYERWLDEILDGTLLRGDAAWFGYTPRIL